MSKRGSKDYFDFIPKTYSFNQSRLLYGTIQYLPPGGAVPSGDWVIIDNKPTKRVIKYLGGSRSYYMETITEDSQIPEEWVLISKWSNGKRRILSLVNNYPNNFSYAFVLEDSPIPKYAVIKPPYNSGVPGMKVVNLRGAKEIGEIYTVAKNSPIPPGWEIYDKRLKDNLIIHKKLVED